jgi:hypothetical protein
VIEACRGATAEALSARSGEVLFTSRSWVIDGKLKQLHRMSLAGYSLTGWSPPEPVSASPAERKSDQASLHRIDLRCLKKRKPLGGCSTLSKVLPVNRQKAADQAACDLEYGSVLRALSAMRFILNPAIANLGWRKEAVIVSHAREIHTQLDSPGG